jgi:hypothetical protein
MDAAGPFEAEDKLVNKGDARGTLSAGASRRTATYYWPMQTHGSMGPSCAVADVRRIAPRSGPRRRRRTDSSPRSRASSSCAVNAVRLIYLDGAGCYGMNGHDDAAADAALLSKAMGRPVRVQWMRADEHAWDPKGPPQLLEMSGA